VRSLGEKTDEFPMYPFYTANAKHDYCNLLSILVQQRFQRFQIIGRFCQMLLQKHKLAVNNGDRELPEYLVFKQRLVNSKKDVYCKIHLMTVATFFLNLHSYPNLITSLSASVLKGYSGFIS
jgi:hypothetical protein